jgi:hypothetical protein
MLIVGFVIAYVELLFTTEAFAEKLDLVKLIIVRLAQGLKYLTPEERASFEGTSLPVESFLETQETTLTVS